MRSWIFSSGFSDKDLSHVCSSGSNFQIYMEIWVQVSFLIISRSIFKGLEFRLYAFSKIRLSLYPFSFRFIADVKPGCHCIFMLSMKITLTPYIVKWFSLKNQGFLKFISQVNEPRRWTFLCIWYENRGWRVHEIERLCFCSTWPCVYPLLWRRTSHVYQDHRPAGPNFLRSACP